MTSCEESDPRLLREVGDLAAGLLGKRENVWHKIAVYNALLAKLSFAL
ncbi:hypothetical protein [Nostoc sp. 106C]|nr:hypothetical protein [Nostoc sp. 106C]